MNFEQELKKMIQDAINRGETTLLIHNKYDLSHRYIKNVAIDVLNSCNLFCEVYEECIWNNDCYRINWYS